MHLLLPDRAAAERSALQSNRTNKNNANGVYIYGVLTQWHATIGRLSVRCNLSMVLNNKYSLYSVCGCNCNWKLVFGPGTHNKYRRIKRKYKKSYPYHCLCSRCGQLVYRENNAIVHRQVMIITMNAIHSKRFPISLACLLAGRLACELIGWFRFQSDRLDEFCWIFGMFIAKKLFRIVFIFALKSKFLVRLNREERKKWSNVYRCIFVVPWAMAEWDVN